MRNMNSWMDTWGRICWFDEYDDFDPYEEDSDAEVIKKIKNYYRAGVDFNMADRSEKGMTPLHYAAKFRSVKIVEVLIDGGADVRVGDDKGRTPLHYAAEVGNLDMVQYLVEHGPRNYEKVKDRYGKTADQYAALNGKEDVVRFFDELAHPEKAKARKEREKREREERKKVREKRFLNILIGLCAIAALSLGGYATAKILKKSNEKSKVEAEDERMSKESLYSIYNITDPSEKEKNSAKRIYGRNIRYKDFYRR